MDSTPPKHRVVEKDGYVLTFYPGFLRKADVEVEGRDDVLYEQTGFHDIRDQPDEPLPRYVLRLQGGPNDRDFTLHVDDPQHAIAEIVVRLYPRGQEPGSGEERVPDETFHAHNDAVLCPPYC
jgi:hypothetical protein